MPEDVELLRLKAKARAKAARERATQTSAEPMQTAGDRVSAAFGQPGGLALQGVNRITSGSNPVAGVGDVLTSLPAAAFSPVSVATAGLREIPFIGNFAADFVESPFQAISQTWDAVNTGGTNLLRSAGVPENWLNLGQTPEQAKETTESWSNVGKTALPFMFGGAAGRGMKSVAEKISRAEEVARVKKADIDFNKKVAPPTTKELNRTQMWDRAKKYLAEEERVNPIDPKSNVSVVRQVHENMGDILDKIDAKASAKVAEHSDVFVKGKPIADAIRSEITPNLQRFDPAKAAKIEEYAKTFDEDIPLGMADAERARLNQLTKAYQKAAPEVKLTMETQHPAIAGYARAVEGLRDAVYNKLEEFGDNSIRELRKDYGAVKSIRQAVERNIIPAEKQTTPLLGKYASPAGAAFATGATISHLALHPKTAIAGGLAGIARDIFLRGEKKNPAMKRVMKKLGESDLQPSNIEGEGSNPIAGYLPPSATITPPPADVSGLQPFQQPYINYGVPSRTPLLGPAKGPGTPAPEPFTSEPWPRVIPDNLRLMGGGEPQIIPTHFKLQITKQMGIPFETPDAQVIQMAKYRGLWDNAPLDEAPGSVGRGATTQNMINDLIQRGLWK